MMMKNVQNGGVEAENGATRIGRGGSLLATLYSALYLHSYSLTVLTSAAQLCALVYYQVSYFPMGLEGLKIVCKAGLVIAKPLVYQCGRALGIVKQKSYLPL